VISKPETGAYAGTYNFTQSEFANFKMELGYVSQYFAIGYFDRT